MDPCGKVKINLSSTQVVAGDYLKGHITIKCNTDGHKVTISVLGRESFKLTPSSSPAKETFQTIFEESEDLTIQTKSIEETFPFRVKIPKYAPSSFAYNQLVEKHDHRIEACVEYKVIASIQSSVGKIAEKSKKFVIISPTVRQTLAKTTSVTNTLKSCWCFPRGTSTITVHLKEDLNSNADHEYKYLLKISSRANSKLDSVVAQVIFELISKIPNEKRVKSRKLITRVVPNLKDFEKDLQNSDDFSIELEFSMLDEENSEFYSVTCGHLFQTKVYLRICAIYNIGWRSKYFELDHEVPVQPKKYYSQEQKIEEGAEVHPEKTIVPKDTHIALYSLIN